MKDASGKCIVKKDTCIEKQITNSDGTVTFTNLLYGDYYIKELDTVQGFILNDNPIEITKNEFQMNNYKVTKELENKKQQYEFTLLKYGETFSEIYQKDTEYGSYYQYDTDYVPLKNITFALYDEDGHKIDIKSTDSSGQIQFTNLDYGIYYYQETKAPSEYHMNNNKNKVSCTFSDNKKENISIKDTIKNDLCNCFIKIKKVGEHAIIHKNGFLYDSIPLKNVVFGIYQNFDYTVTSGNTVPKDSCVGYIITNNEGIGLFSGNLPLGNYYIREIKTQSNYILDETKYYFKISENNHKTIQVNVGNKNTFYNKLSKGSVQIFKTDHETKVPLSGVEFTLYNQNNEKIGIYTTNYKGIIQVKNLPYGKYYFVETKCKNGYYSSNNKYIFTIDSNETVYLNISNTPIYKLGFEETYKSHLIIICIIFILFLLIITNGFHHFILRKPRK